MTERLTEKITNKETGEVLLYRLKGQWGEVGDNRMRAAKKLGELEDAEEDGRLVVLPCKVGDTVWVITHPFNVLDDFDFYEDAHDEIYESYISSVTFYEDSNQYRIYAKDTKDFIKAYFMECDFGKSIFLTREEAEKALEEMEKDE